MQDDRSCYSISTSISSALKPTGIEQEMDSSNWHHPKTGTKSRTAIPSWVAMLWDHRTHRQDSSGFWWSLSSPLLSHAGLTWSESQHLSQRLHPREGVVQLEARNCSPYSYLSPSVHPSSQFCFDPAVHSEGNYGAISLQTSPACCWNTHVTLTHGHTGEKTAKSGTAKAQQLTIITAASIPQKWWAQ